MGKKKKKATIIGCTWYVKQIRVLNTVATMRRLYEAKLHGMLLTVLMSTNEIH